MPLRVLNCQDCVQLRCLFGKPSRSSVIATNMDELSLVEIEQMHICC
jgi:hypothetical protein